MRIANEGRSFILGSNLLPKQRPRLLKLGVEISYGRGSAKKGVLKTMRYAGLLVMPTGFLLCIAAILMFPASIQRTTFVLSGLAVELLGLSVALRGHMKFSRDICL